MVLASYPWSNDRPTLDELLARPVWQQHALCRGTSPDVFFPKAGGSTKEAKEMCAVCPVRNDCLNYAAETGSSGIWAGKAQKTRHVGMIVSSGAA